MKTAQDFYEDAVVFIAENRNGLVIDVKKAMKACRIAANVKTLQDEEKEAKKANPQAGEEG